MLFAGCGVPFSFIAGKGLLWCPDTITGILEGLRWDIAWRGTFTPPDIFAGGTIRSFSLLTLVEVGGTSCTEVGATCACKMGLAVTA